MFRVSVRVKEPVKRVGCCLRVLFLSASKLRRRRDEETLFRGSEQEEMLGEIDDLEHHPVKRLEL